MNAQCQVHIHRGIPFSINNENILELSKQITTKSLGSFMASQSLLVLVQSLMENLICYRPDKNVNFFLLIPLSV